MIKRNIMQKLILTAIIGLFGLSIVNTMMINVKADTTTDKQFVSLNEQLVTLSYNSITANSRTQIGSAWYYTSSTDSSGGSIIVEQAQPYIDPTGIEDLSTVPSSIINPDGTTTWNYTYHRRLPFVWDINVWTSVPIAKSVPTYTTESAKIVTSRLYVGHQLSSSVGVVQTLRKDVISDDVNSVPVPSYPLTYVAPQTPAVKGLQDGNDNWETFKYLQSVVNVPYYVFSGQTRTIPSEDPLAVYVQQQDIIRNYFNTHYAIGNFNVKTNLQIAPLKGMSPTINTSNGLLTLQNQWVEFGGINKLNGYDETGYCNKPDDAVSWYNELSTTDSSLSESNGDNTNIKSNNAVNPSPVAYDPQQSGGGTGSNSHANDIVTTFTGRDLYTSTPTLRSNTVIGSNQKQNTNDVSAYLPSKGQTYGSLVASNIDNLVNEYNWEINLNNFNLVPVLYLHKQTVNVKYTEMWYDTNPYLPFDVLHLFKAPDSYVVNHNAENNYMDFLLGFELNNVYAHVRLQAYIDAFSTYEMVVQQGSDNSHLGVPDDVNGKNIWDNSPVGQKDFNYISIAPKDTLSLLSDFFKANWGWVLLVVIGVVGVVVLIGIAKVGGAISMGIGQRQKPQYIQESRPQKVYYNPQVQQPIVMVTQPQQPIRLSPQHQQPISSQKSNFDPNTGKQIYYDANGNRIS